MCGGGATLPPYYFLGGLKITRYRSYVESYPKKRGPIYQKKSGDLSLDQHGSTHNLLVSVRVGLAASLAVDFGTFKFLTHLQI